MAKRTLIVDDLSGEAGARTRAFRFDGVDYEIDLTDKNFAELRAALKPYVRAARTTGGKPAAKRAARPRGSSTGLSRRARAAASDSVAIRTWAQAQGRDFPKRGRVPATLRGDWEAAGSPR